MNELKSTKYMKIFSALGYAIGPLISSYVYNLSKVWLFPGLLIFTIGVFAIFIVLKKKAFNIKNS